MVLPPSKLPLSWDCSWWSLPFNRSCIGHNEGVNWVGIWTFWVEPPLRWDYRNPLLKIIYISYLYKSMYVCIYIYISSKSAWSAMVSSPQQKCKTWSNVVVYGMVYVWSYPCTSISVREPDTFFIRPPWYLFELSAHGEWVHDLWISKCWLDQS